MPSHINYRAIIRLSLDGDNVPTSALRNEITKMFDSSTLIKTSTGIYETRSSNILDIQKGINQVLENLAKNSANEDHPSSLDHIWIYIDKA